MTIGKSVYPMMQTLCANELYHQCQSTRFHSPHPEHKRGSGVTSKGQLTYSHPAT